MKDIKSVNLHDSAISESAIYNNGELAFLDNIQNLAITFPAKSDIFVIALVVEGKASVAINGTKYEMHENDIFISLPNNIIEHGFISIDFKCYAICIAPTYYQRIRPMTGNMWDAKVFFEKNPKCSLLPEEADIFCQFYKLLCSKIHLSTPVQGKVIDTLMLAFLYDMQYALGRVMQIKPRSYSSGENIFKRFIQLIESSNPKYQSVTHYADSLCVTPKYLSAVCKQASGMTASDMIDKYVQKDIEYMIRYSDKSIKEIAATLNFSNISFFGKYVKKHFGMSPREYRTHLLKDS